MSNLRESVRQAFVTKVTELASTFTAYTLKVEFSNGAKVNTSLQTDPYLRAWIVYQDGQQVNLSLTPDYRLMGTLVLEACVKEGSGTKAANQLLEHFYPAIHMKDTFPPIRTLAARFASKPTSDGWAAEAAIIPFWADSIGT